MFPAPTARRILLTLLPLVVVSGATAAQAQSTAAATTQAAPAAKSDMALQAVDYKPVVAGSRFEVQANDNSELNQEVLDRVTAQLADRGYGAENGAPLVMVVETDLVRGQRQDEPLGQVYANNKEAKVQARLFSTTQNSLLNPKQPIGSADRTYRINIAVYDRATGLYVWRGSVTRSNPDLDIPQATNEMVGSLVAAIGKSIVAPPPPAQ